MSEAFQCDGPCGEYYSGTPYVTYEQNKMVGGSSPPPSVDLCEDCTGQFKDFLDYD